MSFSEKQAYEHSILNPSMAILNMEVNNLYTIIDALE